MIMEKLDSDWKDVSSLIIYSEHDPIVPHLLDGLARKGLRVPQDLAMVCIGDVPHLAATTPPVTNISFDAPLMQEVILGLAQRLARRRQDLHSLSSAPRIRVQPHLIRRASTEAPGPLPAPANTSRRAGTSVPQSATVPAAATDFAQLLRRRYPMTSQANESRFELVDLVNFVNRPLNFRKGWLGDLPLTNLATESTRFMACHLRCSAVMRERIAAPSSSARHPTRQEVLAPFQSVCASRSEKPRWPSTSFMAAATAGICLLSHDMTSMPAASTSAPCRSSRSAILLRMETLETLRRRP